MLENNILIIENNVMAFVLPEHWRDDIWSECIGELQKMFDDALHNKNIYKITVDMKYCRWSDPIPLMSLLLEIKHALRKGINIEVELPESDDGANASEYGPYQYSPNRYLGFLESEGFLSEIIFLKEEGLKIKNYRNSGYKNIPYKPLYENATCVIYKLVDVPKLMDNEGFAKDIVDDYMTGLNSMLRSKIPPVSIDKILYKLRAVLQELLHNAQEHAYYENEVNRLIGIYVRYRVGRVGLDKKTKRYFDINLAEEKKHCFGLSIEWLQSRPGCLEVFYLDRGKGMVKSFEESNVKIKGHDKFLNVMHKTFGEGISTRPDRNTKYGGLHLLYNLLKESGDYVRAFEDRIWFGATIPKIREYTDHRKVNGKRDFDGFVVNIRLSWEKDSDIGDVWAAFSDEDKKDVLDELRYSIDDLYQLQPWLQKAVVVDERFGSVNVYGEKGNWILWLVKPHRMKWDIIVFIENYIKRYVVDNAVLVIADIYSYEAETYIAALSEFKAYGKVEWPKFFSKIIFFSDKLRSTFIDYFFYEKGGHGFTSAGNNRKSIAFDEFIKVQPKPKNVRLLIYRWLKWHDSRLFWLEVNKRNDMYIPEKVKWGDEIKENDYTYINGYLNFHQTMHNDVCLRIYSRTLSRFLSLYSRLKYVYYGIDGYSIHIIRDIMGLQDTYNEMSSEKDMLTVGSVLVNGSTVEEVIGENINIHFFVHNDSFFKGKKPSLLFWNQECDNIGQDIRYVRIGKTPYIAVDGWKAFEIPRYDKDGLCVGYRSPSETYADMQDVGTTLVKIGHWCYEGHHDMITINIGRAVENAFLRKNELARYIVNKVFASIKIPINLIADEWQRIINKNIDNGRNGYDLLIYRSHINNEIIIQSLLGILNTQGREIFMERVIPVASMRITMGGSAFLIPPLTKDIIKNKLSAVGCSKEVLVMDDAYISGRTNMEFISILKDIGAIKVKSFVLVDRSRRSTVFGYDKSDYYWRLDLPTIGNNDACPLCYSLQILKNISSQISVSNAKNVIAQCVENWKETMPYKDWSKGLHPLPLYSSEMKKYCFRSDNIKAGSQKKYLSEIKIERSIGVVLHITELHVMTGRDDYLLKRLSQYPIFEIKIEIIATRLFMFFNEFTSGMRVEIVKKLIEEMVHFDISDDNTHAQLGAITVLWSLSKIGKNEREAIARHFSELLESDRISYLAKILMAYFTIENLFEINSAPYKIGKSILYKSNLNLSQKFNYLYLEMLSPSGNAHSEAIPLLLCDLKKGTLIDKNKINDAGDSVDRISDLIESIGSSYVRKEMGKDFQEIMQEYKNIAKELRSVLANMEEKTSAGKNKELAISILERFLKSVKKIVLCYFYVIPNASLYYEKRLFEVDAIERLIEKIRWDVVCEGKNVAYIEKKHKKNVRISNYGCIAFDVSAIEVWIPWYRDINIIISDLIRNSFYSEGEITDPWAAICSKKSADMWLKVDYMINEVMITMANKVMGEPNIIYNKLVDKSDNKCKRWDSLFDIGGKIDFVKLHQKDIFAICVKIPYTSKL